MRTSIAALKAEVAKVEASMANRPARIRRIPEAEISKAVAEEITRRTPIAAEYVTSGMRLGRQLRLGPVDRVDLALAIEQRLHLVELLEPAGWDDVGDILRDVARCTADADAWKS